MPGKFNKIVCIPRRQPLYYLFLKRSLPANKGRIFYVNLQGGGEAAEESFAFSETWPRSPIGPRGAPRMPIRTIADRRCVGPFPPRFCSSSHQKFPLTIIVNGWHGRVNPPVDARIMARLRIGVLDRGNNCFRSGSIESLGLSFCGPHLFGFVVVPCRPLRRAVDGSFWSDPKDVR